MFSAVYFFNFEKSLLHEFHNVRSHCQTKSVLTYLPVPNCLVTLFNRALDHHLLYAIPEPAVNKALDLDLVPGLA
jgi:hypothetical protein